jgi:hypothetical protein
MMSEVIIHVRQECGLFPSCFACHLKLSNEEYQTSYNGIQYIATMPLIKTQRRIVTPVIQI